MAQHILLSSVEHRGLRVCTGHGPRLGDDVMGALTFPGEFRNVQAHYPIVFRREPAGGVLPLALFGLEEGCNLFLDENRWDATYVPLAMQRQPFLIGIAGGERLVHVDMEHPRVRGAGPDGEALFDAQGNPTDQLEHARSVLLALHDGIGTTPAFVESVQRLNLLEPFFLDVQLDDGSVNRLAGYHTINEERLGALEGAVLERLAREGHLLPLYMVIASTSRFRDLIERMNRRRAASG